MGFVLEYVANGDSLAAEFAFAVTATALDAALLPSWLPGNDRRFADC